MAPRRFPPPYVKDLEEPIPSPRTKEYGIGIIGVGRIANERQIPCYLEKGLKIVAIADINEKNLKETQKRWKIKNAFKDYHELLEIDEIKIVDILTQSWVRPQIVKDSAERGKHILCEKPFARTIEDAEDMIQAAEKANVKLAVHQPSRWYHPFYLTKTLIQKGYIGEPYYYIAIRTCPYDTAYYEREATRWHIHLDDFLPIEWGIHDADTVRWILSQNPVRVFLSASRMPYQNFKSEMVGGCLVDFSPVLKGVFVYRLTTQSDEHEYKLIIEGKEGTIKAGIAPMGLECYSRKLGTSWQKVNWDYHETMFEGHAASMAELINAIYENRSPCNSAQDNLNSIRISLAMYRSLKEDKPIYLKEL